MPNWLSHSLAQQSRLFALFRRNLGVAGRVLVALLVGLAVFSVEVQRRPDGVPPAQAVWPIAPVAELNTLRVVERGDIPMPPGMAAAHASSLLVMPDNHPALLTVFWFSGDRESGPNVQIAASQWMRDTQTWTPARFVVNRFVVGEALGFGIRRLGNPVAWLDDLGRIHLFVVATGGGGWAASRIVHLHQSSQSSSLQALAFAPERVLPLSWFFKTSMLVRNGPLALSDGGMVLPVHFELGLKYPIALRFDRLGAFLGMTRISQRLHLLQPTLVMRAPLEWIALMRDERPHGKIGAATTHDGGRHWTDLADLALDNPDAAVAALSAGRGHMLLAHNPATDSRGTLDLSQSTDGVAWQLLQTLEQGRAQDEFSYPAMVWLDHNLWVTYTVERQRIAWLRMQTGAPDQGVRK